MDLSILIGKAEAEAVDLIRESKLKPRVTSRDGVGIMGTCDFRRDRVNLFIVDGKVTSASIG